MKGIWVFLSMIAILTQSHAVSASDISRDIRDGISGIQWGAKPDQITGPTKTYEKKGILYVRKEGEIYRHKGINLGSVLYGFYENRFFAAYMRIPSAEDAEKLKGLLDTDIGPVRRQLRVEETVYIWDYQDIKVKLKELHDKKLFKLSFYYTPLSKKLNESKMDKDFEIRMDVVPAK